MTDPYEISMPHNIELIFDRLDKIEEHMKRLEEIWERLK